MQLVLSKRIGFLLQGPLTKGAEHSFLLFLVSVETGTPERLLLLAFLFRLLDCVLGANGVLLCFSL